MLKAIEANYNRKWEMAISMTFESKFLIYLDVKIFIYYSKLVLNRNELTSTSFNISNIFGKYQNTHQRNCIIM